MRILLVDDESSVIQSLLAALKTLPGHEVRVATGGAKALENAALLRGVDLLISDVVMEPMDGFTLRDEMAAAYPGLRTIFMSGYDLSEYAERLAGFQFLQKPFDPAALIEAVKKEIPPVPVAVPVAVPKAIPQPSAVAVPKAVLVAQPRAVAASVPTPTAVARAAVSSQPTAVPRVAATPQQPVAVPVARAAVPAQPVAIPRAVATPSVPKAVPTAPAVPKVVQPAPVAPKAVPQPTAPKVVQPAAPVARAAVPQARAVAPQAVPAARPAVPVAAKPLAVPAAASAPATTRGEFTGYTLGSYEVKGQTGEDEWGAVYAAVQSAINRPVSLHVLSVENMGDEAKKERFIADARAKAQVQHPSILAVYEAGENEGRIFFADEYVDGHNLAQLAANGRKIDERTTLNVLRTATEGLGYFNTNTLPHLPVDGTSVLLGNDGQARVTNLATQLTDRQSSVPEEISALGRALSAVVHTGPGFSAGMRTLIGRMIQSPASGLTEWDQVAKAVKVLEPKNVPAEVLQISAAERAAAAALEAARLQQKKELRRNIISMVSCVVIAAVVLWLWLRNREHVEDKMVHIPAGSYAVGDKQVTLTEYWSDKHEVTIGQYAKFLDYLDAHPGNSNDFNHDRQPKQLSHKPQYWDIYYGQARINGAVHSAPYSLDSPMVEVTWWDAYAYAKWRGHDLPSEAQWEAAGRGPSGFVYPWGNDPDPKKVNSGSDFDYANPGVKGKTDRWNYWSPVDAVSGDKSAFGVIGMAGNVSEWVDTWTEDKRFAILKGGNFKSADVRLDKRVLDHDPSKGEEHIGFRTISTKKPDNAE